MDTAQEQLQEDLQWWNAMHRDSLNTERCLFLGCAHGLQHARLLTVTCCCREGDGALEQLQKEVQQWQAACQRAQSALQTSQQVCLETLNPAPQGAACSAAGRLAWNRSHVAVLAD